MADQDAPPSTHGNLVLSFVGDQSTHGTWLVGDEPREFDLALVYYGDDPTFGERQDAEFFLAHKGFKYWLLKDFVTTVLGDLLPKYERIWLPDDDIAADTQRVNRLFRLFEKHQLQIAQPAIGGGPTSYQSLRPDPRFEIRYTGYVEVMCPLFRYESLMRCASTFRESRSSWGLDWIWSTLYPKRSIGVIDAVAVDHTRPFATGSLYTQLAGMGVTPYDEYRAIRRRYGIRNRSFRRAFHHGTARLQGVTAEGTEAWNRPLFEGWFGRRSAA